MRRAPTPLLLGSLLALCAGAFACRSVYYDVWETLGREKRHILTRRVEASQREQQQAQEQFLSAFEVFKQVTRFEAGDLEKLYRRLEAEYERSESRAGAVRERIASIQQVAEDLFEEWEGEIQEIGTASLRRRSQASLRLTRTRYGGLIAAMRRAESRMDPVLKAFRDQVLFLKHNLNARAVAALEGNVVEIEDDVAALVREMQTAIREAEDFVASMQG